MVDTSQISIFGRLSDFHEWITDIKWWIPAMLNYFGEPVVVV